jgi:hypothetical protein
MPIVGYPGWPPVIDAGTREHVRFAMSDGHRLFPCRISVATLRDYFGDEGSEPIDLFESFQGEIEDVASEKYDKHGIIDGLIELENSDLD